MYCFSFMKALIIIGLNLAITLHADSSNDCLYEYEKHRNLKNRAAEHVRMGPQVMKEFFYIGQTAARLPINFFQGLARATRDTPGPMALFPALTAVVVPLGIAPFTTAAGIIIPIAGVPSTGMWMAVNWAKIPTSFKRDYALYSFIYDIAHTKRLSQTHKETRKLLKKSFIKEHYTTKKELFFALKDGYEQGFFCQPSSDESSPIRFFTNRDVIAQIREGNLKEFLRTQS